MRHSKVQPRQIWGGSGGRSFLGFPVRGVLLYQSLKMIKKRTPHRKFSIYPPHPFLICTVQYCPRFHFPEFDGRSKAWSSTRHGAWALENTRRRPPFVPSPCIYDSCISQHQTAHVHTHKRPPRGGVPTKHLVGTPHGICTSSKQDPTLFDGLGS